MKTACLPFLFLLASRAVSEDDGAFLAAFQKNLSTAAAGQIAQTKLAESFIDGNTTSTTSDNNGAKGDGSVSQDSLTLHSSQVNIGSFIDGQTNPGSDAGQVPSRQSRNNFINFCATQKMPLTNGVQHRDTASCNPIIMGAIPPVAMIPTTTFFNPVNGATLKSQTPINFQLRTTNMVFGSFVNAQSSYYSAPQQLDDSGKIIGHSHMSCNSIKAMDDRTNPNALDFVFFLGINTPDFDGIITAPSKAGLPAGMYRCCSMTSSSNHQPVIVPVAQRVSQDDCVRFTVSDDGDAKQNIGNEDAAKKTARFSAQAAAKVAGGSTPSSRDSTSAGGTHRSTSVSAGGKSTAVDQDRSSDEKGNGTKQLSRCSHRPDRRAARQSRRRPVRSRVGH